MTTKTNTDSNVLAAANLARMFGDRFNARITLAPEDGTGTGDDNGNDGDEDEAAAAAAKAAEELAAAEAAAAAALAAGDKPTDAEAKLLKETMKAKAARQKAEADLATAQAALKAFDGIDPVKVRELLAAQTDAEKKALEAKGDYERLKQMMADEHKTTVEALRAQIAERDLTIANSSRTIDNLTVGQAFTGSTYVNDDLVLTPSKARTIYGAHFDVVDGEVVAYDKPRGENERTMFVDGAGKPLSFDAAMKKLIEADPDRDRLVKAKLKPGAGSKTIETKGGKEKAEPETRGMSRISLALSKGGIKGPVKLLKEA